MTDKYQEALYRILKGNPNAELSMSDINKDVALMQELIFENRNLKKENQILKQSVKDTYDTSQEIIGDLKKENQELKAQNKLFDETIEADDRIICQLTSELDTFKLAFYTMWKCCNKNDISSDIDSDFYLEFRCGYESLFIPVTEQEIESIEKACELLDMKVKEVLEND